MKSIPPLLAGFGLLVAGAGLAWWISSDQRTDAERPDQIAGKIATRPKLATHSADFPQQLRAARHASADDLRSWAAGLSGATLRTLLREGCAHWDPLELTRDSYDARRLLAALAMEAGRRDIDGLLAEYAAEDDPSDLSTRPLVAAALSGFAEIDPARAWDLLGEFVVMQVEFDPGNGQAQQTQIALQDPSSDAAVRKIFEEWAKLDPHSALSILSSTADPDTAQVLLTSSETDAIAGFVSHCPPEFLPRYADLLQDRYEHHRQTLTFATDVPFLDDVPIPGRLFERSSTQTITSHEVATTMESWLARDPVAALEWFERQPFASSRDSMFSEIATREPERIAALVADPSPELQSALAGGWLDREPERAFEMMETWEPERVREELRLWAFSEIDLSSRGVWTMDPAPLPLFAAERRALIHAQAERLDLSADFLDSLGKD